MKVSPRDTHVLPGLTPKADPEFDHKLDQALEGTLPVYFGAVPLACCIPSDPDYRPDLHPLGEAALLQYGQMAGKGKHQYLWVYQRGVWFVVADNYIPLFAALRGLPDYVPSMILGKPVGDLVKDLQGPITHDEVRQMLGFSAER